MSRVSDAVSADARPGKVGKVPPTNKLTTSSGYRLPRQTVPRWLLSLVDNSSGPAIISVSHILVIATTDYSAGTPSLHLLGPPPIPHHRGTEQRTDGHWVASSTSAERSGIGYIYLTYTLYLHSITSALLPLPLPPRPQTQLHSYAYHSIPPIVTDPHAPPPVPSDTPHTAQPSPRPHTSSTSRTSHVQGAAPPLCPSTSSLHT